MAGYTLGNTEGAIKNGQSRQHGANTRRIKPKQKHNRKRVEHHYAQTNTNNINKTWSLLQTGGKDQQNIVFVRKL